MYYVYKFGVKDGPYTTDELKGLRITDNVLIWKEGLTDWMPANMFNELKDVLISAPPPTPKEKKAILRQQRSRGAVMIFKNRIFQTSIIGLILSLLFTAWLANIAMNGGSNEHPTFVTENDSYWGLFSQFVWRVALCVEAITIIALAIASLILSVRKFPYSNQLKELGIRLMKDGEVISIQTNVGKIKSTRIFNSQHELILQTIETSFQYSSFPPGIYSVEIITTEGKDTRYFEKLT